MIGAIHCHVNLLNSPALYSRETTRSFGTGGGVCLLRGLSFLYQGFFTVVSSAFGSTVMEDLVVVVVKVLSAKGRSLFAGALEELSLPDTTTCKGSVATGSSVLVDAIAPSGSGGSCSPSRPPLAAMVQFVLLQNQTQAHVVSRP